MSKWIDVATEKTQQNLIHGIEEFDPTKLKHAETQEKNPLPDKDGLYYLLLVLGIHLSKWIICLFFCLLWSSNFTAIEQEKEKLNFINGIENFDPAKLKHTETQEKNPLPTKETIEEEKQTA